MGPTSKVVYSQGRTVLVGVIFFHLIYNNVFLFVVYKDKVKKDNYPLFVSYERSLLYSKNCFLPILSLCSKRNW